MITIEEIASAASCVDEEQMLCDFATSEPNLYLALANADDLGSEALFGAALAVKAMQIAANDRLSSGIIRSNPN